MSFGGMPGGSAPMFGPAGGSRSAAAPGGGLPFAEYRRRQGEFR